MKCGKYKSLCRYSLFMHIYRDSSSVVCNCTGSVFLQNHMDQTAVSRQMFIHRIIYDLIDQMVKTSGRNTSDIHSRTLTDRLQTLQNRDTPCIIGFFLCHICYLSFLSVLAYFLKYILPSLRYDQV